VHGQKKLEKAGFLKIFTKISQDPTNTLLLDPTAEQAFSQNKKKNKSAWYHLPSLHTYEAGRIWKTTLQQR